MINLELKSIENYCLQQKRIIENLKDVIQDKDNQIAKLFHQNKGLLQEIETLEWEKQKLEDELQFIREEGKGE